MEIKKPAKSILIAIITGIVFLIFTVPFRNELQLFYVLEVRPSAVLNPVLGMVFGLPAIIGCMLANFALDMFWGDAALVDGIIFMIPQFLYGFIPYALWKRWNRKDRRINTIDNVSHVLRFIAATTIGSLVLSVMVGTVIGYLYKSFETGANFAFFCFINNAVFNQFLGIPLLIGLNKLITHEKLEYCERLLLRSALIEAVTVVVIINIIMILNPGNHLHDVHVWERIYLICMAVIAFIIAVSITIIALWMQNKLSEKEYDLSIAASIQSSMLPTNFVSDGTDGYSVFASMAPAKEVAGDFYDFFQIDDDHVAVVNADVSGKGLPAALFMMRAAQAIRGLAKLGLAANEVLEKSNDSLAENNKDMYFVTAWLGILNTTTGEMVFANGGHNKPILKKQNGEVCYVEQEPGIILGIQEKIKYTTKTIKLQDGDTIFIYTDGITEAKNRNNEMFKEDRLLESVRMAENHPEAICEKVYSDVKNFTAFCEQYDDITMLAIKYERRGQNA